MADLDWHAAQAVEDTRRDYGERRLRVAAMLGSRLHVAVVTMRGDAVHVISFAARTGWRSGDMIKADSAASRPDEDSPEWTEQDFAASRPVLDVAAEVFGAPAAGMLKQARGRPLKAARKVNQTLRLDPDVLEAYRNEGSGWQARINILLREHMPHRK